MKLKTNVYNSTDAATSLTALNAFLAVTPPETIRQVVHVYDTGLGFTTHFVTFEDPS